MTTTKKKETNYESALIIANRLKRLIKSFTKMRRIAGSIRRKEAYVGDIEIVCIPKFGKVIPPGEIFPREMNLVIHHIKQNSQLNDSRSYTIHKGGTRYYQLGYYGMQVDLFMTTEQQWGRMLAMRTGPADYSKRMAARWVQMGYKGHEGELVRLRRDKDGNRIKPEFPTEESFLEFLGWDYIEPEKRG